MQAHNLLFWFSLATGVIALGAVTLLKIARGAGAAESPQVAETPDRQV